MILGVEDCKVIKSIL